MLIEELSAIDSQNMFNILKSFPTQVREACEIGKNSPTFQIQPKKLVILGMGGSAIGGDLLRSYCLASNSEQYPDISINRNYEIPAYIDERTCVIASSYSGNTEETISGLKQVIRKTDNVICISTGGKLSEIAIQNSIPLISIPSGYQPRCAIGYSFFPMLYLLLRSGAFSDDLTEHTYKALDELHQVMDVLSETYSRLDVQNPAIQFAHSLYGKVPVIYSNADRTDAINLRWRCQIQENAKNAAFGNLLPEMNHNEINGWSFPVEFKNSSAIVFIKDIDDHPKTKIRFDVLGEILREFGLKINEAGGKGKYFLTRMFELIYFGDWISYYLAIKNGVDPTPIPLITKLKNALNR